MMFIKLTCKKVNDDSNIVSCCASPLVEIEYLGKNILKNE
jgi:hypothetical protein